MSKKAKKVAEVILKLKHEALDVAKRDNIGKSTHEMHWIINDKSQPYNDCLEAMKRGGLISDYNLAEETVKE